MNKSFEEIFRKLQNEALELHYRWDLYKEIYAGDTEQFELINSQKRAFNISIEIPYSEELVKAYCEKDLESMVDLI